MKAEFYIIRAITNLHVGSGDSNFGVIDNLVQRDPITELPTIFGSSLKGALREHFEAIWGKESDKINSIFGSDAQADDSKKNSGDYKFLAAQLLTYPVRSNKKPFFIATTEYLVSNLIKNIHNLNKKPKNNLETRILSVKDAPCVINNSDGFIIEDFNKFSKITFNESYWINLLGVIDNNLVLFNDEQLKQVCGVNNLPVIARNYLENGKSENLWYEEIVPRETRFWTCILYSENNHFSDFEGELLHPNVPIQIGANATVGYGLCEFIKVNTNEKSN